jgi:DNA polymerase-3 subunit delta
MASKKNDDLLKLKKQLKDGVLSPLYVFYGEEDFLREMYVDRVTACVPDGGFPEFNHIKLDGADVPFSEYDDAWESFPMMTDKKLIHIKDSGIFSSKRTTGGPSTEEKKDFWLEKFKRISNDTVVVFDESSVDKRSALYKAAVKAGTAVEFAYLSDADLVTWVVKQCLNAKKRMSKENAYYLITLCDSGLNNINNELQKLLDFCDEEIYKSDIDRVVSKSMQVIVFELTDAIMAGNTRKAMSTLTDLKTVRENAFTLLYLLFSSFEKMLHVKVMSGVSRSEAASELGVAPFIAGKYIDGAKGFSEDALTWMVRRIAEIDLAVKEGRTEDWAALEQYVMECIHMSSR